MISIFEVRTLLPQAKVEEEDSKDDAPPIYGVMAEFDNPTSLVNAAREARARRLPQAGRLFAVPHRRTDRGAASAPRVSCR